MSGVEGVTLRRCISCGHLWDDRSLLDKGEFCHHFKGSEPARFIPLSSLPADDQGEAVELAQELAEERTLHNETQARALAAEAKLAQAKAPLLIIAEQSVSRADRNLAREVLSLLGEQCSCEPTGDCTKWMSGPTCFEGPACPPCQHPDLERDPNCPLHSEKGPACENCNRSYGRADTGDTCDCGGRIRPSLFTQPDPKEKP